MENMGQHKTWVIVRGKAFYIPPFSLHFQMPSFSVTASSTCLRGHGSLQNFVVVQNLIFIPEKVSDERIWVSIRLYSGCCRKAFLCFSLMVM